MKFDTIVKNGRLVTPFSGIQDVDVAISGDKVAAILQRPNDAEAADVIDAGGNYVLPGLIDPHVHFGLGSPAGEAGIAPTAAELSVLWVDGTIEAFGSRALDQYHTLRRGEGR